jgi:hypothetical protein
MAGSTLTALPHNSSGNVRSPVKLPDNLSADGTTAFFQTAQALVPEDTNGMVDVYEWHEGEISLVSDGSGAYGSEFLGASADGSNVFFATRERLSAGAIRGELSVYDARVGGGFSEPAAAAVPCSGEACRGPASAPAALIPAGTAAFSGSGNDVSRSSCSSFGAKAEKLNRRAKTLRRRGRTVARRDPERARRLRGQAARLSNQVRKERGRAKQCRRQKGRSGK